ncbi:MAG: M50 family metallopeptidase [Bradymonadaceae bacterium]|nr:M50 family metallopeptidase [Lujinxingiaceae bacterium]
MTDQQTNYNAKTLLLIAIGVVVACMIIPFGALLIYPFRLFGTFVHETAHALAAVLTGGEVVGMSVNWDTSGLTLSRGGSRFFTASAGYLGSMVVGAGLLVAGRRPQWAKPTLIVLGAATLLAMAFFGGYGSALLPMLGFGLGIALIAFGRLKGHRDDVPEAKLIAAGALAIALSFAYLAFSGGLLTWAIGLAVGGAFLAVGLLGSRVLAHATVLFTAVTLSLDGLESLKQLVSLNMLGHGHNDAATLATLTGVPATLWAFVWSVSALLLVGAALWIFWRDEKRQSNQKAFATKK